MSEKQFTRVNWKQERIGENMNNITIKIGDYGTLTGDPYLLGALGELAQIASFTMTQNGEVDGAIKAVYLYSEILMELHKQFPNDFYPI